jgi:MFS transporter, DHA1 family, inner membrane transport protein
MAFLRNRAVNWINLHSGIQALAQGMGGVFVLVFLLREGVSVPATLCAMALIFAARFAMRPAVPAAATRFGLKPLVIGGSLVIALQYPLLAEVHGVDGSLLVYCLISALGDTFYWTTYHAYFALLGDSEHRGHQISAGIALSALVGIVAPLLGAWALLTLSARQTFAAVGLIQALAAVPLLATPNVLVPQTAPGALRAALPGVGLSVADGWLTVPYVLVWQIGLFYALGESLSAYGGAMAFAALVGAVSGLLLGRHIDAGHGRNAVVIALSAVLITLIARTLSLGTPLLAVGANALGAFAGCLLGPAQMTPTYNLAKASPCALRFHVAAEGGWDVGCVSGCLTAALLIAHGASLSGVIPIAFLGVAGQLFLLRRYYLRLDAWT